MRGVIAAVETIPRSKWSCPRWTTLAANTAGDSVLRALRRSGRLRMRGRCYRRGCTAPVRRTAAHHMAACHANHNRRVGSPVLGHCASPALVPPPAHLVAQHAGHSGPVCPWCPSSACPRPFGRSVRRLPAQTHRRCHREAVLGAPPGLCTPHAAQMARLAPVVLQAGGRCLRGASRRPLGCQPRILVRALQLAQVARLSATRTETHAGM